MQQFDFNRYVQNNVLFKEAPEKPKQIYTNDWAKSSPGKKIDNWEFDYDEHGGTCMWFNGNIDPNDLIVFATPGWEGAEGTAVEVYLPESGDMLDQDVVGDASYPDFESYAEAVQPYLSKIENKYNSGGYAEYLENDKSFQEGVTNEVDSSSDDRMEGLINQNILKSFLDAAEGLINDLTGDGFDDNDVIDFLVQKIKSRRNEQL